MDAVHRLVMDRAADAHGQRLHPEGEARQSLLALPAPDQLAFLRTDLEQRLVALLGFPAGTRIEPHRALRDLGLDFLLSVSLRNALAAGYGLDLPATLVFDHPTLTALADHLLGLIAPQRGVSRRSRRSGPCRAGRTRAGGRMSGTPPSDPRDVLRRALVEIRSLKEKLAAAEKKVVSSEPIAVVGIGCRFAGGIDLPAAFWRTLMDGRDTVTARPANRWRATNSRAPIDGAFLDDVEGFDAALLRHRAARGGGHGPAASPAARGHLGGARACGDRPARLAGSPPACSSASATNDYARRVPADLLDRYFGVGSSPAVASGRIAYPLDLRGPCLTLDTACSSSLVAVHLRHAGAARPRLRHWRSPAASA